MALKKKEQFFSLQEPYQIATFYLRTGCCGAAAAENVYLQRGTKHVGKILTPGIFYPAGGGSPQTIMQPWKVAYLIIIIII